MKMHKSLPQVEIERVDIDGLRSRELNEKYKIIQKVGQGTYGSVYKAHSIQNPDELFALKHLNTAKEQDGFPITAMREMKILQKLDHINILKIREVVVQQDKKTKSQQTYIVLDYMQHDFQGLLKKKVNFEEKHVKCVIQQLLQGMDHLHSNNIIHRDLKSANLLINDEGILKVADFGFARNIQKPYTRPLTPIVVTLWYRAPEILLGHGTYNEKSDVWSIGCFFLELILQDSFFKAGNETDQVKQIFQACGTPSDNTWPGVEQMKNWEPLQPKQIYKTTFKETISDKLREKGISDEGIQFVCNLMELNPDKRYSTQDALNDEYFKQQPLPCSPSQLPTIQQEESHELQAQNQPRQQFQTKRNPNQQDIYSSHSQQQYINNQNQYQEDIDPKQMNSVKRKNNYQQYNNAYEHKITKKRQQF